MCWIKYPKGLLDPSNQAREKGVSKLQRTCGHPVLICQNHQVMNHHFKSEKFNFSSDSSPLPLSPFLSCPLHCIAVSYNLNSSPPVFVSSWLCEILPSPPASHPIGHPLPILPPLLCFPPRWSPASLRTRQTPACQPTWPLAKFSCNVSTCGT